MPLCKQVGQGPLTQVSQQGRWKGAPLHPCMVSGLPQDAVEAVPCGLPLIRIGPWTAVASATGWWLYHVSSDNTLELLQIMVICIYTEQSLDLSVPR